MNKWVASAALGISLLTTQGVTPNGEKIYREKFSVDKNKQEKKNSRRHDVLFTVDDGPTAYSVEIAKTLDSLNYE